MKTSPNFFITCFILLMIISCTAPSEKISEEDREELIEEIRSTEREFKEMAAEEGVKEAFVYYAAEDGVLNRGGQIIKGKEQIGAYFEAQPIQKVSLQWEPIFIDVSNGGDMAYTYGPFTFSAFDSLGQELRSQGYFHTVWKLQEDGSWRYVYD